MLQSPARSLRTFLFLPLLALCVAAPAAHAAAAATPPAVTEAPAPELAALADLESRVTSAKLADQCIMLAQLASGLTELAGKQLTAGHLDEATATVRHLDSITERLHAAIAANPKHLQDAEMMLHNSARRFADIVRVTSDNSANDLHTTLKHLDAVHAEMLSQLFRR